MNLKQTIKVLEEHNRWRRDNNVPAKTKMAEPKVLGMALDRAIEELNKLLIPDKMNKNVEESRFKQNPKLGISVVMQRALDWWNELPLQNIYDCRNGWANQVMIYYPEKTDCQDVTIEEILYMYVRERGL